MECMGKIKCWELVRNSNDPDVKNVPFSGIRSSWPLRMCIVKFMVTLEHLTAQTFLPV